MARILYSLLFYLLMPFVLLRLLYRAWKAPAYARRWQERFGLVRIPVHRQQGIWVHAVSVGETIAAVPMIKALQQKFPQLPIMVTTMTPTGSERVQAMLGDSVDHVYAPYDTPDAVQRFLRRLRPRILIVMETELWPNTLHYARANGVPVVLANARLSERSARGYRRVAFLARPMLRNLSLVAAQGAADAERFRSLGLPEERVRVTGSIKFDLQPKTEHLEAGRQLKQEWDRSFVWVAASTHEGEDELLLAAHRKLCQAVPDALLILVPRHPERFGSVAELVARHGFALARRSAKPPAAKEIQIMVGDTMGEMMLFLAAADVAFVGGSLIERGGHNPLEPASLGLPVLMGPHVFNFQEICDQLSGEGGLIYVGSAENLFARLQELAEDASLRNRIGGCAQAVVDRNRGALDRLVALVAGQL